MAHSKKPAQAEFEDDKSGRNLRTRALILCAIVVLCLAPYLAKPFHIDDPLFVWSAQQIAHDPLDPYGFDVNWYGSAQPMSAITKNPPLASYYLALAGSLMGWSEVSLHGAMLIPAALAILGTFVLAGKLCDRPMEAALVALVSPVFLVSATNVMCDVMMLAIWVWAVVLWMGGLENNNRWCLFGAAVLAAMCPLTKYFGIALVPLLFIFGVAKKRGIGTWAAYLLLPPLVLASYYLGTRNLYHRNLLSDAMGYTTTIRSLGSVRAATALAFTGGCLAAALFYAARLWPRVMIAAWAVVAAAATFLLSLPDSVPGTAAFFAPDLRWVMLPQFGVWCAAGLSILALAAIDVARRRDAESILLFVWVLGTFWFAGFVNWTVNGRSILPMVPAVAILMMRRIDARKASGGARALVAVPLVLLALLSLSCAGADLTAATAARKAAHVLCSRYSAGGHGLWFVGHWGFQYYMQELGARPIDSQRTVLPIGAYVAIPRRNANIVQAPPSIADEEMLRIPVLNGISMMSDESGAGFYASTFGPLPYVVGPQPPDIFGVVRTTQEIHYMPEVSP